MKKKIYSKSFRKWMWESIEKWRCRMLLQKWHIDTTYMKFQDSENPFWTASCSADPIYYNANIRIYPRFLEFPRSDWEQSVIHELLHITFSRYARLFNDLLDGRHVTKKEKKDAEEQTIETIASTIWLAWTNGVKHGEYRALQKKSREGRKNEHAEKGNTQGKKTRGKAPSR